MTTIEQHKTQRTNFLEVLKDAYQKLIAHDRAFWTKNMKALFEQCPELTSVSWKQGFFYNDENHVFGFNEMAVNGLEISSTNGYFSVQDRYYKRFDSSTISLKTNKKDEQVVSKELIAVAQTVAHLLVMMYGEFGERHFADTFGKKAAITFNNEGLLVEDYDDYDTMDTGSLDDLFDFE